MAQIPKAQFTLLQAIVARRNSPTLSDIDEMLPSQNREDIQAHLQQLIESNIVDKTERGDTSLIYRLTDEGRHELAGTGLFDAEATLKHFYQNTSPGSDS